MRRPAFIASLLAVAVACSSGSQGEAEHHPAAPGGLADPGDRPTFAPAADGGSDEGGDATRTEAVADAGDADVAVAPFHIVGRFDARDAAGPRFGWPGTEIRARFSGSGISLELADTKTSYYDVSIDGAPPTVLIVNGSKKTYEVASGLGGGVHDLVVTKRTETSVGVTQLFALVPATGGAIVPTPAPTGRRIEMVGDSITCGFGVLGTNAACPFEPSTESEPGAWGSIAAKEFGALHSSICVSGVGVSRNYGGDATNTMPDRYARSLADDSSSTWSFSSQADLVVVNLGTNDFAGDKGDPGAIFETKYVALLADIRAKHPNAWIVVATSPMLSGSNRTMLEGYVQGAIAARTASGDAKVTLLDLDEQTGADGFGCSYHPSATTQAKMAARLVAHVKPLLGW